MEIKLPPSFSDLTLKQLTTLETETDILKRISACSGLTADELRVAPMNLLNEADKHLKTIQGQEVRRHLEVIKLDGVEYGFIPDWDEFTAGEWIDLEDLTADFWGNVFKIMAILYRPITTKWGDSYEIESYTAKENPVPFMRMSADIFAGAMLFFSSSRNELLNTTQFSLMQIAKIATNLPNDGDGTQHFTDLPKRTFSKWTRLRGLLSGISSHIFRSLKI